MPPILSAMKARSAFAFMALALVVSACGPSVSPEADGVEVYIQVCARCHADNLTGGLGPPLVGEESPTLDRPEAYIVQTITSGLGRMPSFRNTLTEEQIQLVTDYIFEQQGR